ncbi:MAG: DNA gyrase C-terminal beta-propeller domain-containing protein, partial [Cyanobacteriota bacterium]
VSERGVIVRMRADAVPQQSRAATGVRLQRLDSGDRLAEVVLVPPALDGEDGEAVADPDLVEPPALSPVAGPLDSLADPGAEPGTGQPETGEPGTGEPRTGEPETGEPETGEAETPD